MKAIARGGDVIMATPGWARFVPKLRNKLLWNLKAADGEWFEKSLAREIDARPDLAFGELWGRHRKWLKRQLRDAERGRFKSRCRSALRRFGFGRGGA